MVNITAPDIAAPVRSIQTVASGQPVLHAASRGMEDWTDGMIVTLKGRSSGMAVRADASIADALSLPLAGHSGGIVGQMKPVARQLHGDRICGIQAEKPYPWLALSHHIGPHVELRKTGEPGHCRAWPWPYPVHPKWHHADPCRAIKGIDSECRRYQVSE